MKGLTLHIFSAFVIMLGFTACSKDDDFDSTDSSIADPDNEATAIGEISADGKVTLYNHPVYNLAGQRQSGLQHGQINIVGGKKIYVR